MKIHSLLLFSTVLFAQPDLAVEKRVLGQVTLASARSVRAGAPHLDVAVSDDGKHLARVRFAGSRRVVDLDGSPSQEWDEVGNFSVKGKDGLSGAYLVFSPNGSRLAYVAREGARIVLVVDNKTTEIEPQSLRSAGHFQFSSDGSRYAMVVSNPTKAQAWVIIDGAKYGPYGDLKDFRFSADGKHYAYVIHKSPFAAQRAGVAIVIDGKESPLYMTVADLQLSIDGQHFIYAAQAMYKGQFGEGLRVIVDGKPSVGRYQKVSDLQLSADGQHHGFIGIPTEDGVNPSGGHRVIIDGKPGKEYFSITELKLSPDGMRHVFVALLEIPGSGTRNVYVFDGRESRDYPPNHSRGVIFFSPDSRSAAVDGMSHVLVDGQEYPGAGMSQGGSVRVGVKGSALAFRTKGDDNIVRVYVNGKKGPDLTSADLDSLAFSPDGAVAAYPAVDLQGKRVLVIGDKVLSMPGFGLKGFVKPDVATKQIVWSADGSHVALVVDKNVVLDAKTGPECNFGVMPLFSPDGMHFAYACSEFLQPNKEQVAVYVDGQRALAVDAVFVRQPGTWKFSASGALEIVALVGIEAQALQIKPPGGGLAGFGLGSDVSSAMPGTTQVPAGSAASSANPSPPAANPIDSSVQKATETIKKKLPWVFGGKK